MFDLSNPHPMVFAAVMLVIMNTAVAGSFFTQGVSARRVTLLLLLLLMLAVTLEPVLGPIRVNVR